MRLLFDEQLSEDLCDLLRDDFPDSLHVRQLGFGGASDQSVWELARTSGCLLVTKDEEFHRLSVLRGAPPKVVWIRLGNRGTGDESVRELPVGSHRLVCSISAKQVVMVALDHGA